MPTKPTKRQSHKNNLARLTAPERACAIIRALFPSIQGYTDRQVELGFPDSHRVIVDHLQLHVKAENARAARRKAK